MRHVGKYGAQRRRPPFRPVEIAGRAEEVSPETAAFICTLALQSAIQNRLPLSPISDLLESEVSPITIIDNRDGILDRFVVRGAPPASIPILTGGEPAQRGDNVILPSYFQGKIIIFIYWKNGSERVDLDLSVIGYGNNYSTSDQYCSYTRIIGFKNTVRHSGDIRDAPDGAAEYITFRLDELKTANPDINHIMIVTQSYNCIAFEEMGDAFVGIGIIPDDDSQRGDGPEGSIVLDAFRLTGKCTTNVSGILRLSHNDGVSDKFQFLGINAKNSKASYHSTQSAANMLVNIAINFEKWSKSANAPITLLEKEVIAVASRNSIDYIQHDGIVVHIEREAGEDNVSFFKRIMVIIKENP
jgi:hypothetical protein